MSTIKELHTVRFWLTPDGRLEIYDHRLATRVNKVLKRYLDGALPYRFVKGEEAVFYVTSDLMDSILYRILAPKLNRGLGVAS